MNWMKVEKWRLEGKILADNLGVCWIPTDIYPDCPHDGFAYLLPDIDEPRPWITFDCVPVQGEGQTPIDPLFVSFVPVQNATGNGD